MRFAEIRGSGLGSVITENNSTKYYLRVNGQSLDIPGGSVRDRIGIWLNNKKINTIAGRGLNGMILNADMTVANQTTFDLYGNVTVQTPKLIEYLESATEGQIVILFSHDAVGNTTSLNNAMKKWGAGAWCYHRSGQFRYAWCGIFDPKNQNMVADAAGGMGNEFPAEIDYYIDTAGDLGITGAGQVVLQDGTEYSGKGKYLIKSYFEKSNMNVIPQIQPNEWIRMQCDFKQDKEAKDNGVSCVLNFQFYDKSNVFLKSITISKAEGTTWNTNFLEQQVPANAEFFDIGFYHFPSDKNLDKGNVYIRNVVIQPITAPSSKKLPARLGRFTAPTQQFSEGTTTGTTVVRFTKDELLEASEMQEINTEASWVKVFEHRMLDQDFLFENLEQGYYSEVPYLYSNMKMLPDLRLSDGRWRFKLEYANNSYIVWEQTSSVEEGSVRGLKVIENKLVNPAVGFMGLRKQGENSRYNGASGATWYYAIGAIKGHNGGFPGEKDRNVREVRLYAWKE